MKPKISIIIPVGNLLRDFSNLQEYLKIVELREVQLIIVIDDPAPNALTLGFLKKFNENHLNLRIVHSSYGNPGGARNIGIDSSDSDWITFWDSDDSVDLSVFKSVIDNVKLESNYMYASSLMLFSKKEKILEISSSNRFLKSHFIRNPGIWRCIIPSAIARDISFPQSKMGEDQVFLSFVLGKVSDIKFINYGYYFHQNDSYGSLTNVKSSFSELEISIKEIEKIFKATNA